MCETIILYQLQLLVQSSSVVICDYHIEFCDFLVLFTFCVMVDFIRSGFVYFLNYFKKLMTMIISQKQMIVQNCSCIISASIWFLSVENSPGLS